MALKQLQNSYLWILVSGAICGALFYHYQPLTSFLYLFVVEIIGWLKVNQWLQTIVAGSAGTSIYFSYWIIHGYVVTKIYAIFRSDITIDNSDPSYTAVIEFIVEHYLKKQKGATSNMHAETVTKKKTWKEWRKEFAGLTKYEVPKMRLKPNDDSALHRFEYNGHDITFLRVKGETLTVGYDRKPLTREKLTLSTWGTDNSILIQFLQEAVETSIIKADEGMSIFVMSSDSWMGGWEKALVKKPRNVDSVIFDVDHAEHILSDARRFLSNGEWYASMGIPFRRGYLLYGPPGCGKTSFAQVLASELKLDICILNLAHKNLTDNSLASNLRDAPENALILLEDVDAIFVERNAADKRNEGVSFSGLLNAIDGVAAQEGRIFFMTTNYVDKLDPALVRPGRCDVKLEVKRASKLQLEKMFLRFFPNNHQKAQVFAKRLPADEISMAQLQGHFLQFSHSADACLEAIPSLLNQSKPHLSTQVTIYAHLKRVGLEKYAAAFEYLGVNYESEINQIQLTDLCNTCHLLQYDVYAKKTMALLLKRDENFMKTQYAIADLSSVRDCFLAAYPTLHEQENVEVAPVLRRQNSLTRRQSASGNGTPDNGTVTVSPSIFPTRSFSSYEEDSLQGEDTVMNIDIDEYLVQFVSSMASSNNDGLPHPEFNFKFETTNVKNYPSMKTIHIPPLLLERLSRKLCEVLSFAGKSVVSLYQLNRLIQSFPDRPVQCVLAASELTKDRPNESYLLPELSIVDLLKRSAALNDYHAVSDMTIDTLKSRINEIRAGCKGFLTAIFDDKNKDQLSSEHILFHLPSKRRIIWEFLTFYTTRKPEKKNPTDVKDPKKDPKEETKEDSGKDANKDTTKDQNIAMIQEELPIVEKIEQNSVEKLEPIQMKPVVLTTREALEDFAYRFANAVCDGLGNGLVSLREIHKYLETHKSDPEAAVKNAAELFVINIPPPRVPPPPVVPSEFVYKWLGEGDPSARLASDYGANFIGQGLVTEEDLRIGGKVFEDDMLKAILGVRLLGHRRKIIHMHDVLLKTPIGEIKFQKCCDEPDNGETLASV